MKYLQEAWTDSGFGEPGACFIDKDNTYPDHLIFACPGCGKIGSIVCTHPKSPNSWDIESGNLQDPATLTLSPSIHCVGCCGWHGYLRNGEFQSC